MVREYIGARYVPKFMGNYDITQAYEALCVVDNGSGTSYISKIPTPAGTPLTDTTYWAIYGASSGAILNLQNQIDNINNNELPALKKPSNNYLKYSGERLVVFIGDSYTQVPSSNTSFVGRVANYLGITSSQYHNIGVSGDGLDGYKIQVDNYNYTDADSVTDVVITGGINDAHSDISDISTIEAKIDTLYNAVVAKFPNATIWAGFCGGGFYRNLSTTYAGFNYDNMMLLKYIWMERWAAKPKCVYMDNLDLWCRSLSDTDYYLSGGNGMHPYSFGIKTLAEMITNYLKGGSNALNNLTSINCPFVMNPQLVIDNWNMPSILTVNKKGKMTNVTMSYGNLVFTNYYPLFINNSLLLGGMIIDPNNEQIATYFNKLFEIPITIGYTTAESPNVLEHLLVVLRIDGSQLRIYPFNTTTAINIKQLVFPGFYIDVPTDMLL